MASLSEHSEHNEIVRREFTHQAEAYAANPLVADHRRLSQLVQAVQTQPGARVLDVATGPGYVAMGFAEAGCEVVGIDLTDAPLALAEQMRQDRGLTNLHFQFGNAEHLPFEEQSFDIVVSRLAMHHFEDPYRVLSEMARVCRKEGLVVIEDMVASEFPARAAYYNQFEQLRDPSHTRALSLSDHLKLLTTCGLEVEQVYTYDRVQAVEQWLKNAHTPDTQARKTRALIEQDERENLSGTHPFRVDGALHFHQRNATFVSRKTILATV